MGRLPANILILEDSKELQMIIRTTLSQYRLTFCGTLADARTEVARTTFDLFILDIHLPDGDSYDFCAELRRSPQSADKPILFISARSAEYDRLNAFAQGADDYIAKPFSVLELRARVQVKLKSFDKSPIESFTRGPLTINLAKRRAYLKVGASEVRELKLTNREFALLVCLSERPDVIMSRQTLLDKVWGSQNAVTERTVDVHIHKLRRKLGPCANLIMAEHGHGYVFTQAAADLSAA